MTPQFVIHLGQQAIYLMLMISAPMLLAGLTVGLIVSILQAVTQIQEQTLSFVPKIVGMAVVAIIVAPWAVVHIMEFAARMFGGE